MGAAEYIVKYIEQSDYWEYPQQTERRWTLHRNIEVCRSIDENICLGLLTIELTDDGKLISIIDGRERTAVLYEMLHPEARTDGKRLLMRVGYDEYTPNEFEYVDVDYLPKRPFECWVSTVADTLSLACMFNEPGFRKERNEPGYMDYQIVSERLKDFNKHFQTHTIGLSLVSFYKETLGDSVEVQRVRLRGRLNRT